MLADAEQDWRNGQVHLVDKSCAQVLPDRTNSASEPDVLALRRADRAFKGGVDSIAHEVKSCTAFHSDRSARVVGKHKHGGMIGWIASPLAFPAIVGPGPSDRTEHISSQNPGAEAATHKSFEKAVDSRAAPRRGWRADVGGPHGRIAEPPSGRARAKALSAGRTSGRPRPKCGLERQIDVRDAKLVCEANPQDPFSHVVNVPLSRQPGKRIGRHAAAHLPTRVM
jgi:hypothetical protein